MELLSIWEQKFLGQKFDFIIVGAGICGSFSAYFLKKKYPKAKILVVDKKAFGNAASTRNAGFACFGSAGELLDDLEILGLEKCRQLLSMRIAGLKLLKQHISPTDMEFNSCGGFEVFSESENEAFEKTIAALDRINENFKDLLPYPFKKTDQVTSLSQVLGMIAQPGEGSINPLRLMQTLQLKNRVLGVQYLESCEITGWEKTPIEFKVNSNFGPLQSQQLICTTNNLPFLNSKYKKDIVPARAQVIFTKPLNIICPTGVFHSNRGYTYFRFINKQLLLGGFRNLFLEQEQIHSFSTTNNVIEALQTYASQLLDQPVQLAHSWAGTMSVGANRFPVLEMNDGVGYGLKMGGMGMAIGAFIGKEIASFY